MLNQKIREELKDSWKLMKMTIHPLKNLWDTAKVVLREKHIAMQAPLKKLRKNSNTQANLTPKGTGERTANKTYTQ